MKIQKPQEKFGQGTILLVSISLLNLIKTIFKRKRNNRKTCLSALFFAKKLADQSYFLCNLILHYLRRLSKIDCAWELFKNPLSSGLLASDHCLSLGRNILSFGYFHRELKSNWEAAGVL